MSRLAFPFAAGPSGRSMSVDYGGPDHVKQMLELLIFTMAGERVMRPDFGSPVSQMVFTPGNGPLAVALQATLQATITQQLGNVLDLQDLSVDFDENDAALSVSVTYEVLSTKSADSLYLRKDLT